MPLDLPFPQASRDLTAPLHFEPLQSLAQMQYEKDYDWQPQFLPLWHALVAVQYQAILSKRHQHLPLIYMALPPSHVTQLQLSPSLN